MRASVTPVAVSSTRTIASASTECPVKLTRRPIVHRRVFCTTQIAPHNLLSYRVRHFSIGKTNAMDALIWLGRDKQISFGIEF